MSPARSPALRSLTVAAAAALVAIACSGGGSSGQIVAGRVRQALDAEAQKWVGTSLADKELVLTFDDGPAPLAVTGALSTWLASRPAPIRATFFLNGACIAAVPATLTANESCAVPEPEAVAVLDKLVADRHLVANHATTHRDLTTIPEAEIAPELVTTHDLIAGHTSYDRRFFRAPGGAWSAAVHAKLAPTPMNAYTGPIYWDIGGGPTDTTPAATMAADWECWDLALTTKACGDRYLAEIRTKKKGIVLFHDRGGDTANHALDTGTGNTVDMVKYVVEALEKEGFTFKPLEAVPAIAAVLPACDASCSTCSGPTAAECTVCAAGRFLSGGACVACKVCAAGTYPSTACSATADTVCAACDASCTACTGPTKNDCACPTGSYLHETGCTPCRACTAGTYLAEACGAKLDNFCAFCPRGTFSKDGATACTPCPEGTHAAFPASTGCAACACDDGDPCTKDSCTTTTGCLHAPIVGCIAPDQGRPGGTIDSDEGYAPAGGTSGGSDADISSCSASGRPATAGPLGLFALALGIALGRRRRAS